MHVLCTFLIAYKLYYHIWYTLKEMRLSRSIERLTYMYIYSRIAHISRYPARYTEVAILFIG